MAAAVAKQKVRPFARKLYCCTVAAPARHECRLWAGRPRAPCAASLAAGQVVPGGAAAAVAGAAAHGHRVHAQPGGAAQARRGAARARVPGSGPACRMWAARGLPPHPCACFYVLPARLSLYCCLHVPSARCRGPTRLPACVLRLAGTSRRRTSCLRARAMWPLGTLGWPPCGTGEGWRGRGGLGLAGRAVRAGRAARLEGQAGSGLPLHCNARIGCVAGWAGARLCVVRRDAPVPRRPVTAAQGGRRQLRR
jgi:hypothetical protein